MRLFTIASSPFIRSTSQTNRLMLSVILALIPGIWAQWYFFGWGNLVQLSLACVAALSAEAIILILRQRDVTRTLADNSALLTAMLLGVSIPSLAPWWVIVIGTLFAIVIAKQLYGGLGQNLFNPAMVGYVVLLISFPVQMTAWSSALNYPDLSSTLSIIFFSQDSGLTDAFTAATPLDVIKNQLSLGFTSSEILSKAPFGEFAGIGWQWVNLGFAIGGLFLLSQRVISFHLCFSFLASLLLFSSIGALINPDSSVNAIVHLFSGATMLGAFFIITDPVTAATSNRGRIYYGILIALLVYIVRTWGAYPDALAFAVLIANMSAPLIDKFTQPRTYGHQLHKVKSNQANIKQQDKATEQVPSSSKEV